ncbi:MAG: sulfatase-like hydrolase/transferase [Deltaproteobacteria bacterium]|nr:sulfatase-like hydrolase/transferase [Deltaproteobacteria bacterium]
MLAVTAMLPLVVLELLYVLVVGRPSFGGAWRGWLFVLTLLAVPLGFGVVLGALESVILNSVSLLTEKLAKQRLAQPRWMARIYGVLALPLVALFVSQMFSGRRAKEMPLRHVYALAVGATGIAGVYLLVRLIVGVRDRFRIRRWDKRQARWLIMLLSATTVGFYFLDQCLLSRLYPALHVALAAATVLSAQLGVMTVHAGWRASSKRMGRVLEPNVTWMVAAAAVAAGAWGLSTVAKSPSLRYVIHQHTALQGKWVQLSASLGMLPNKAKAAKGGAVAPWARKKSAPTRSGLKRQGANVLLVSVDALRADHLGAYGYQRGVSPKIDAWAKNAAVFERAYCAVPHTSFSVRALLTGRHKSSLGDQSQRTMAAIMRKARYKTAAFFPPAVFYIDAELFRVYREAKYDFEYVKYEFIAAERRVDQVLTFLREDRGERPFFVWAHFFEPHEPYVDHPGLGFGQRAMDRYDSEVAYTDRAFGRLVDHVLKHYPNTIIALTADHGEAFGEHGSHYHGNTLYEEQIRVPLILSIPGVAGRRVAVAAQTVDLSVTLLKLVGAKIPAKATGHDLGPWIAGEPAETLPPAFCELHQKRALIGPRYKLIYDTDWSYSELYDLKEDPGELNNIAAAQEERVGRLQAELKTRISDMEGRERRAVSVASELLQRGRKGDRTAIAGLVALARDGTLEQRRESLSTLLDMRTRAAREVMIASAHHADPGVAIVATVGAAMWGDAKSFKRLPALLNRPDLPPHLRRDAWTIRAKDGDLTALEPLIAMLRVSQLTYESIALIKSLGALGDARAAPALVAQLERVRTRRHAVEALGAIRCSSVVPDLGHVLAEETFVSLRVAAARALGNIGDNAAIPLLTHVVERELESPVVNSTLAALDQLGGLPLQGPKPLSQLKWRCEQASCSVDLNLRCEEHLAEDLLLVFPQRPRVVEVLCGSQRVAHVDTTRMRRGQFGPEFPPSALLAPLAGKGDLTLRVQGGQFVPRYVGMRARPKAALAVD